MRVGGNSWSTNQRWEDIKESLVRRSRRRGRKSCRIWANLGRSLVDLSSGSNPVLVNLVESWWILEELSKYGLIPAYLVESEPILEDLWWIWADLGESQWIQSSVSKSCRILMNLGESCWILEELSKSGLILAYLVESEPILEGLWWNLSGAWWTSVDPIQCKQILSNLDESWWILVNLDESWWILMNFGESWGILKELSKSGLILA